MHSLLCKGSVLLLPGLVSRIIKGLSSTELAIALFGALTLVAIPGTFTESRAIYSSPFFVSLLTLMALNLVCCSMKRWHSLAGSTLVLHGGVLVTLLGCVITSFGYVSTVNIYEGTFADEAFRWDLKRDVPFDMQLWVKKINRQYYPVPVRVGVLRGSERYALFTLATGESFELPGYRVLVSDFEPESLRLLLVVQKGDRMVGTADTSGNSTLPADFPYAFKLVSYKNPQLKRMWVDLQLSRDDQPPVSGTSEINAPFSWQGLYFYHTQTGTDGNGRSFAGIQIVKDPGRPVVFCGFAIMCLGAVLAFWRRFAQR